MNIFSNLLRRIISGLLPEISQLERFVGFSFRRVCSVLLPLVFIYSTAAFLTLQQATELSFVICRLQASKINGAEISPLGSTPQKQECWMSVPLFFSLSNGTAMSWAFSLYYKQCWLVGEADAVEMKWFFLPITTWIFLTLSLPRVL